MKLVTQKVRLDLSDFLWGSMYVYRSNLSGDVLEYVRSLLESQDMLDSVIAELWYSV